MKAIQQKYTFYDRKGRPHDLHEHEFTVSILDECYDELIMDYVFELKIQFTYLLFCNTDFDFRRNPRLTYVTDKKTILGLTQVIALEMDVKVSYYTGIFSLDCHVNNREWAKHMVRTLWGKPNAF